MHVAIIGAGISGLLTALELLEQNCQVTILDQQQPGKAASWAGGGILSPMYPWRYPQAVNDLAKFGKDLYQEWNTLLKPQTGIDFEIHDTGMLIFDQDDFDIGQYYARQHKEPMQQCELLQGTALNDVNPRISASFEQAMYFPQLSNIRNPRLLKSILRYLEQHPRATILANSWVDSFDLHNHQVQCLNLQNGQRIQADQYVIATGAWSAHWSQQLKCHIPVKPVQGQMLLFKTPPGWLPTMCMHRVMYLIPRLDGHIVCGSSMEELGFEHRPNVATQQQIYQASLELVPELKQFPIVKHWAGLRPGSPHGIPAIGQMMDLDNLWANFGHFRNGLCMGPAAARLLRQMMLRQKTLVNPGAYEPDQLLAADVSA